MCGGVSVVDCGVSVVDVGVKDETRMFAFIFYNIFKEYYRS